MNNPFNFSNFTRQSPKGIFVIYTNLLFKGIKVTWFLLILIIKDFSKIKELGATYFYLGLGAVLLFLLIRAYLTYKNFQFNLHLGHHAALGTAISLDGIIFDHGGFAIDGDLISVNTMLLHFMPKEQAIPVWGKILLDTAIHIGHFSGMVFWSAQFYVTGAFTVLGAAFTALTALVVHPLRSLR